MEFGQDAISYASFVAVITLYRYYRVTRQREVRTAQLERGLAHANRALLLPVDRIDRVQADRNYVRLHSGGTAFTLRGSLTSLAERLDPEKFLRINRSEIVRLDAVKELQPWYHGDYRVVMGDGTTLMWSRRFRAQTAGEFGDT